MTQRPTLSAIADAIDLQGDEFSAWLNRETGEIEQITSDLFAALEDDDDLEYIKDSYGVTDEEIAVARKALDGEPWLPLPSRFDINEYRIMQQFCHDQKDPDLRDRLLAAINGKGAFKRFKDTAARAEILEEWFDFRYKEIREIARAWCEEKGVGCG
ncbi:MAG: hypothetical protein JXA71_19020 [Chitinispirillaceae bacterium]|nr:hypothetical protein [Chitinispirillaceae bacterium]